MKNFPVYNLKGEKVKEIELSDKVFGLEKNDDLLHQVYVAQSANRRQVIAHTKDRSERAGSGKKPWKQKGTGRARVGSVRTPVWRKGGIVFGPTKDRNFKKDVPQKMKQKAVAVALSGKLQDKELFIVENYKIEELKTKMMRQALDALKIKGRILMGFSKDETKVMRASQNLPEIQNINVDKMNVFDILNNKNLLLSEESLKVIEGKYTT